MSDATPVGSSESAEDNYYASIEAHFVERRGAPLFISPAEWQLVWHWEQAGIPLRVVKEGIDRVFERPRTLQKQRKLGYCRQTVEALFRRFRESRLGDHEEDDDRSEAEEHLSQLVGRLRKLADSSEDPATSGEATRAADYMEAQIDRLSGMAKGDFARALPEIEEELRETEDRLLSTFEHTLGAKESGAFLREAETSLVSYRDRMPEKVYQSAVKSAYRRRLRARLDLTPLSLFDR